jgi:hypothetical protein
MTASTNTIYLKLEDGSTKELNGVMFAEETSDSSGTDGVAIQFRRSPHESQAKTEFIPGASLNGVYDSICQTPATDEFATLVNTEPTHSE